MSDYDYSEGHRVFSAQCFNRAWEMIDRSERSDDETAHMIDAAHASRYHWVMRGDAEPRNLAISAWQLSRVYAAAGLPDIAAIHAQESLDLCQRNDLSAFLTGYAFEALGRAAALDGNVEAAEAYVAAARDIALDVEDDDERSILLNDIDDIAPH